MIMSVKDLSYRREEINKMDKRKLKCLYAGEIDRVFISYGSFSWTRGEGIESLTCNIPIIKVLKRSLRNVMK